MLKYMLPRDMPASIQKPFSSREKGCAAAWGEVARASTNGPASRPDCTVPGRRAYNSTEPHGGSP